MVPFSKNNQSRDTSNLVATARQKLNEGVCLPDSTSLTYDRDIPAISANSPCFRRRCSRTRVKRGPT